MDDKYNIYMISFYLTNIIIFTDLYHYMNLKILFWNQKSTPDLRVYSVFENREHPSKHGCICLYASSQN